MRLSILDRRLGAWPQDIREKGRKLNFGQMTILQQSPPKSILLESAPCTFRGLLQGIQFCIPGLGPSEPDNRFLADFQKRHGTLK